MMRKSLAIGMTMIVLGVLMPGAQGEPAETEPDTETIRNRLVHACRGLDQDVEDIVRRICDTLLDATFCVVAAGIGVGGEFKATIVDLGDGFVRIEAGTDSKLATPWGWLEGRYDQGFDGFCMSD